MPALRLTASPRQSESDAGSLLLRLVFESYVRKLGWRVPLTVIEAEWKDGTTPHSDADTSREKVNAMDTATKEGMSVPDYRSCLEPSRLYLSELVAVLSQRLDQLAPAFEQLRKAKAAFEPLKLRDAKRRVETAAAIRRLAGAAAPLRAELTELRSAVVRMRAGAGLACVAGGASSELEPAPGL